MIKARFGRPARDIRAPKIRETLLETGNDLACLRIPRWNGTACAGIATLDVHLTDAKAYRAAFFFAEEVILP